MQLDSSFKFYQILLTATTTTTTEIPTTTSSSTTTTKPTTTSQPITIPTTTENEPNYQDSTEETTVQSILVMPAFWTHTPATLQILRPSVRTWLLVVT